jgi:hypothetical protein
MDARRRLSAHWCCCEGCRPIVLHNIPGLIEANEQAVERNKLCISRALRELPQCRTALCFVLSGGDGGRLSDRDVAAFKAIQAFRGLENGQLADYFTVVQNNLAAFADEGRALAEHELEVKLLLNRELGTQGRRLSVAGLRTVPQIPE